MNLSDFNYQLPPELIAQHPLEKRDQSQLMVLDKKTGAVEHKHFSDIEALLQPGDCLIMNNSRVIPARLMGHKKGTGGIVEMVLLKPKGNHLWEVLVRPGKRAKTGNTVIFGDGLLTANIEKIVDDGNRIVSFDYDGDFYQILDRIGQMPLPHYIKEDLNDKERYQTVYAKERGSAAAPTAGLHFTEELLERIRAKGVETGFVTLHVGLGTFRPVSVEKIEEHHMHSEWFRLPEETADLINRTKQRGGRVIAVGTTTCRTLESVYASEGKICPKEMSTDIFIYPGFQFHAIDALITNFHLPESTLIMLVSAFAGYENTMHAYAIAVKEKYRFFSFGDAMFIH